MFCDVSGAWDRGPKSNRTDVIRLPVKAPFRLMAMPVRDVFLYPAAPIGVLIEQ